MKALTLVTTRPGKLDAVAGAIRSIRGAIREVMVVTGRADVVVFSEGSIKDIRNMIVKIGKVKDVVTTETMFEMEVS